MSIDGQTTNEIPEPLREKKTAVTAGERPRATVRELLSWFDAARRGYYVVQRVRNALDAVDLITFPDFEGEYIDQEIFFVDKKTFQPPSPPPPPPVDPTGPTVKPTGVRADPSHRLGRLKAANRKPVSVSPNDVLEIATTLMLTHDFSQLPVMQSDFNVKGIIGWKTIGSRLALKQSCRTVQDCMEQHHELRDDASLFDAIRVIAEHDCVLVRDRTNKITGLVTGADISEQFHLLAEPFLLLGDIENRIRLLILPKYSLDELRAARNPGDAERNVDDVSDLTFGEYVRLLDNDERWAKLGVSIDRGHFCDQLKRIRDVRNDVMHFDPDGITEESLLELRRFGRFLERLQHLTGMDG